MTEPAGKQGALSDRLGWFGRFDRALFRIESVIVVTSLILMSVMVFTDVVYQLVVAVDQYFGDGDPKGWLLAGCVLGFVGLMGFAATGTGEVSANPEDEDEVGRAGRAQIPLPVRLGVTVGVVVGSIAVGYALLHFESSTTYRVVLFALGLPVLFHLRKTAPVPAFVSFFVGLGLAFAVFGALPTGYSWSQSYALLLLLWVGFLGASIASRQRRHLRIDLARKLLPPRLLPHFNALSYFAAAVFTSIVLYLGFVYMFGPDSTYLRPIWDAPVWLPEATRQMLMEDFPLPPDAPLWRRALQVFFVPSEPGELPDWLKVLAIPVSMALIVMRFVGHAIVFGRMAVRHEEFVEQPEVH